MRRSIAWSSASTLAQPPADAVDGALDAHALGLGLGDADAVRSSAVRVLDAARELLEARLVEAELVLEAVAPVLERARRARSPRGTTRGPATSASSSWMIIAVRQALSFLLRRMSP